VHVLRYWCLVADRVVRDSWRKLDLQSPTGWFKVIWPLIVLGVGVFAGRETGSALWGAVSSGVLVLLTFGWALANVPPQIHAEQDAAISALGQQNKDLIRHREEEALAVLDQYHAAARRDVRVVVPDPIFLIHSVPVTAQMDQYLIDTERGADALADLPQVAAQEWWQCGKPKPVEQFRNPEAQTYTRVYRTGIVQYYRTLDEELLNDALIDGKALETEMLRCAASCLARYKALEIDARIIVSMTLLGMAGKVMGYNGRTGSAQLDHVWMGYAIVDMATLQSDDFRAMFDTMWRSFGWSYSPVRAPLSRAT